MTDEIFNGNRIKKIEDIIIEHIQTIPQLKMEIELLRNKINQLETWTRAHIARIENPHKEQL